MVSVRTSLLGADDPPPVLVHNPRGRSPFLFVADHAGNAVPAQLQMLGVSKGELNRHIGWDIGVRPLAIALSEALDAALIHQHYSRLVIDCNRAPDRADAIPEVSDGTAVRANRDLTDEERAKRTDAIHAPYHAAIAEILDERRRSALSTILVALHSFTPQLGADARPWHVGVLHDRGDVRFARQLLTALRAEPGITVGDNQPYQMDGIDYTIPSHAYSRGLPYAEIEVRQDQLGNPSAIARWAVLLGTALRAALERIG